MKRGKKLLVMLAVLVLLLGGTLAVSNLDFEKTAGEAEDPSFVLFTLDTETVTGLDWYYSEQVNFVKDETGWHHATDEAFTLKESYIETALAALSEITAYKTIENVEDWDQYGLEIPYCEITVTAGETYTLAIGQESSVSGQRYFSVGDGNAYLVDSSLLDSFSYGLYDLLAYEEIPDLSTVTGMELKSSQQSYAITYQENSGIAYSDEYVWFMDGQTLDTELTKSLLTTVTGLTWLDCVNYNASDLSQYGLDEPIAVVSVDYAEGSFTLEIGSETGDYSYARIAGSNMVYKIKGSIADTLLYTTYYELRPDEVLLLDWEEMTSLEIILDGVTYEMTKGTTTVTDGESTETEKTVYLLDGEEVSGEEILNALDAVDSTGYASGVTPERTEEIRFVIHRDNEAWPEVEVVFYRYDSTSCLTLLNGEATVFAEREAVVNLVEKVNSIVLG